MSSTVPMTGDTRPVDAAVAVGGRPFIPGTDVPAIVELIADASRHDGSHSFPTVESLTVEWAPTPSYDPERDTLVVERADRIDGFARVSWREREGAVVHRIEITVRPAARRQGLGRGLLAWAGARARASVADGSGGPLEPPHLFGGNTTAEVPAGMAFAADAGFTPVRYHFEMRRPLDEPIPAASLPEGVEVRPVVPEHHRPIWNADDEAFRDHWDAAVATEDDYDRFFAEPDLDTSLWQVAWDGDEVAGLVINGIYPHENEQSGVAAGWLDSVATRRPWRRRGVAGALIARSLAVLRERGMQVAVLGVDSESPTGALGLYESFGFRKHRTWVFLRKPF